MSNTNNNKLYNKIIEALKTVHDPEIPVNIYDLGLIYEINISEESNVYIKMTLTNPNCPVADNIVKDVEDAVKEVEDINKVDIDLVFEPQWNKDLMSDAAKLELGLL